MSKRVCIHERVDTRERVYDHSQSKHVSLACYYYCVDVLVCVFYWHSKMDDLRRGSFFGGGGHSNRRSWPSRCIHPCFRFLVQHGHYKLVVHILLDRKWFYRFQRVGRFLRSIWPNPAILTRTLDSNVSEVSFGQSDQIRLIETVKLRNKETSLQSYLVGRTLWMSRSITCGCDDEGLCVLLQWNNKRRGTGNKMSR